MNNPKDGSLPQEQKIWFDQQLADLELAIEEQRHLKASAPELAGVYDRRIRALVAMQELLEERMRDDLSDAKEVE